MFVSSPAIVLNRVKHTDSTFITTLYTKQMGSVSFCMKIPKTAKSQLKHTLIQPLNLLSIEWDHKPNSTLQHIRNFHSSHPYSTIYRQSQKVIIASFLTETINHALRQEHQGEVYEFIEKSLLWFDEQEKDYDNFHLVFLISLAKRLGFEPLTENCRIYRYFDLINGEYCNTTPTHNYYLQHNDAKHIPLFINMDYTNMTHVALNQQQRMRALRIITTYLRLHITNFPKLHSLEIFGNTL